MTLELLLTRDDIPEDVKREITKVIVEQKKAEDKDIRTKTRLEYLLKSSPAVIYSCEPWGEFQTTYMSENVKEIVGHETQKFLFNPNFWINGIHPDDRQRLVGAFENIVTKEHFSETYRFNHKNGTWLWMLDEATLVRDDQGKPIEIVGYWTDITPLKQAEEVMQKLTHDLRERVKELTCLYEISRLVGEISRSESEVFRHIIELIPRAWQYPEITCVRIIFRGETYSTDIFKETTWKQSADIWVSGKKSGSIEVYYLEERPSSNEGPFLKEEKDLINAIAGEIGKYAERKQIEEQLRSERENFYNILNSTDDGIYIVNSKYEFEFINTALEKEFGPVEGKKCYEYFNQSFEECSWCTMKKIFDGDSIRWERTLPRNQKTYDIIDSPFKNIDGTISLLSILRDITERKQMEKTLKQSEEKYRSFVENFQGIAFKGYQDYSQDFFLGQVKEITGYTEDDFLSGRIVFRNLIHPKDSQRIANEVTEFHSSSRGSTQREYRIIDKKKEVRWLQEYIQKFSNEDERKRGVYGTIQEITKRKQAEEALRESQEFFTQFMNHLPAAVFIKDEESKTLFANKYLKDVFGGEKWIGKTTNELFPKEVARKMIKDDQKALTEGLQILTEELKDIQDVVKTYKTYKFPIKRENKTNLLGGIAFDITEQKQAEEQLQYQANLLEYVSDAVIASDLDFNITSWNKNAELFYGWQESEVLGKNIAEVTQIEYPYDTREDVVNKFRNDGIWRGEVIQKRKDGSLINILASVASVKDGTGKPIAALAVNRDITERIKIEEKLRESEEQYRTLFENIPIGLYRTTPNHEFLAANPTFIKQVGLSSFEELSKIDTDKLASERKYPRDRFLKEISEKGEVKGLEYPIKRPDSTIIYFRENARSIKDSDGSILYYEGSIEDITDRVQAEKGMRESEERYRMLFDESPISLWEVDGSNVKNYIDNLISKGEVNIWHYLNKHPQDIIKIASLVKVSDINSATLKLFKAERKEEVFQNFTKILGKESFLTFKEMITTLGEEQRVSEIEGINYTLAGEKINVILRSTIVPGYEETFSRILISVIDITERIVMEKALRESEERLRRFMDSATDGFTLFDSNLNFLEMNRAELEGLELTREQVVGKNIKDIFDDVQETGRFDKYLKVIKTGKPYYVDDVFSAPRIGQKYYSVRAFKVGEGLGAISTDITERVRAEKTREELEQRRDSFVWMTSHELRTPLTVLTGYCDFLIEHIDDLTQKRMINILGVMKSNLDRLERLTSKVSSVGQIERGVFEIVKTSMNLCEFLEDSTEPYQHLLGEQFKFQGCQEDPSVTIDGDPNKLQQVLDNIIGNAIKQTDKDNRRIIVTSAIRPMNIKIEISDNGAGIAPSNLAVIFDQFVSIPTEYSATGTGIGLYLCRKILEAHGGIITARSKGLSHGSTFIIELPRISAIDSNF